MISNKAQIMAQPLLYIAIVLIMALVLIFGYKALSDLNSVKDETLLSSFILDLEDNVEVFYNYDVGSSQVFSSISLPTDIEYVCVYNPYEEITVSQLELVDGNLLLLLGLNNKANVFTIPLDAHPAPAPDYYIPDLRAGDDNPVCVKAVNGKLQAVLETVLFDNGIFVEFKQL